MRRAGLVALAGAGAAVGLLAEQQGYAWPDLRGWLPDLVAGWSLIALGIALLALHRPAGAAALLLVAGATWFAFNFETTGPAASQWLAAHAAYVHRGPLLALALALPRGRPRTRVAALGVTIAWLAALAWPLWDVDESALVLATVFVAIAAAGYARAKGRSDRAIAAHGFAAVGIVAAAIGADALGSLAGGSQTVADVTVLGYSGAVTLAAVVLFRAALLDAPTSLAERAVALERGGATLRDALRDLLGDPALDVGFAAGAGTFVDDRDRPLAPPAAGLVATPVTVAGQAVGLVVHGPETLDNEATRSAVLAAVGLASQRARLRAEVDRQVDEIEASRRRLLLAEEEERRRLAGRLDRGPGAALVDVERLVREASSGGNDALAAPLERASDQLAQVRPELDSLVRGLGGLDPDGLVAALERLAVGLPLEVELELELADVSVSPEVASALWFVCSESLANVVKHAVAHRVRVTLAAGAGVVLLGVEDDGRGGANPQGPGLVGLADRVAALGGRLEIGSSPAGGTRVAAELPLGD